MSIQSDIEILTIEAIETYALQNHLSAHEVNELFEQKQVFEKIVLQHEYLHQISFDEVMEFIEKTILEDSDELILFHGTVYDFTEIDLNQSYNRRDFGRGFYTTLLKRQAKEWGYRLSLRERAERYYLYQYVFRDRKGIRIKRFHALDKEWLEFIKENRSKGGLQHNFDIVVGPVADDETMETVQLYLANILSAEEAVTRLRYNKVNNQVSFHTEKALECLNFSRRDIYER